ncbi:unnamed protein product [Fraxinus pennsylvanica]|uniref:Uncharacterized protein n=1 Tax=Fraxinus pennsylvanica TaxID=56036 RepID=A0AAD2DS07_9LAMI|nr:unnamed protein product [Fraxinus pennsylvanica]
MATLLLFTILSLLFITQAEDRVHGLINESPTAATSPEAYAFFDADMQRPNTKNPCDSSDCSSLPLAATVVQSARAHESTSTGGNLLGANGVAGIPFAFAFACLVSTGIY